MEKYLDIDGLDTLVFNQKNHFSLKEHVHNSTDITDIAESMEIISQNTNDAKEATTTATKQSTTAEQYAIGETNSSKYYYEQSKEIFEDLSSKTFVTGLKGNAETIYRYGDVEITPEDIGLGNVDNIADSAKSVKHATSADSATKLATARTLKIGSTGKSFNGTAAISWSLSEIGAMASSHELIATTEPTTQSNNDYWCLDY